MSGRGFRSGARSNGSSCGPNGLLPDSPSGANVWRLLTVTAQVLDAQFRHTLHSVREPGISGRASVAPASGIGGFPARVTTEESGTGIGSVDAFEDSPGIL